MDDLGLEREVTFSENPISQKSQYQKFKILGKFSNFELSAQGNSKRFFAKSSMLLTTTLSLTDIPPNGNKRHDFRINDLYYTIHFRVLLRFL